MQSGVKAGAHRHLLPVNGDEPWRYCGAKTATPIEIMCGVGEKN
jgi:hypothetical protein